MRKKIDYDSVLAKPSEAGTRGKSAEKLMREELEELAKAANLDYERLYDARSSRGTISVPQTGDFALYYRRRAVFLEVKEVKHGFRLPLKNLGSDQIARLKKRRAAGCMGVVAIRFMPADVWRFIDIAEIEPIRTGSWDFSKYPVATLQEGMRAILNTIDEFNAGLKP